MRSQLLRRYSTPAARAWASCLDASGVAASRPSSTHEVTNQAEALEDYNAYAQDPTLVEAVAAAGAGWAEPDISEFGAKVGSAKWQAEARAANRNAPVLHTHNRFGRHIDVVEYHPS